MTNKHNQFVITLDGTSASGKSTLSEMLESTYGARRLEYSLFFRIIAQHMIEQGFNPNGYIMPTVAQISEASRYAQDLTWEKICAVKEEKELHSIEVSRATPYFAGIQSVCDSMDTLIRALIENSTDKPVIVEGRTMGKYVYPQADLKLFVDADLSVRAKRRATALRNKGKNVTDEGVLEDLKRRDAQDMSRDYQPTGFDPEIHTKFDTTNLTIEETLAAANELIKTRLPGLKPVTKNETKRLSFQENVTFPKPPLSYVR